MKKEIHPVMQDSVIKCACGTTFKTKSVKPEINVEVCSNCHPAYQKDGKISQVKKAGNVEKFNKKYGLNQ